MLKKPQDPTTPTQEGPRNFCVILPRIGEGSCVVECSRELFELTSILKEEAKFREAKIKGSLTLKLSLEVDGSDDVPIVKVTYDVTTKAPKPQRRAGHFWFSQGGNLTHEAPKQTSLPLREAAPDQRGGIPNDLNPDLPAREA